MDVYTGYTPRPAFLPFHNRIEQEAVLVCHRRAGKTVAIDNDAQKRCLLNKRRNPPPRYAWFYPTRVRAKDIAWGYLKHYASRIPGARALESELAIEYPHKGRVTLYGADNARGVGLYLDGVYYDEADEIPRSTIADVAPALADYGGFAVYAGMLKGRYNLWKRYQEALGNPSVFKMMLRASESGIINPLELARLRTTMGDAAYEMQLECNANAAIANAIYGEQMDLMRRENRIKRVQPDPTVPLDFFLDVGHALHGDDWSIWANQLTGRDVLLLDYYARTGKLPAHYAEKMLAMADALHVPVGTVYLPHDGNREDRKGQTAKDDLEAAGIKRIKIVPRTPHLWDSINNCRALMARMYIDQERCSVPWMLGEQEMPSGIDCLDFYTKKQEAQSGLILDVPNHNQYSHGCDALRTFCEAYAQGMLEGTSVYAASGKNITVSRDQETPRRSPFRQINVTRGKYG